MVIRYPDRFLVWFVLMKPEDTQQYDDHDDAQYRATHGDFTGMRTGDIFEAVQQQMVHGDAQEKPRHETHDQLRPGVGHGDDGRKLAAEKGHGEDRRRIREE